MSLSTAWAKAQPAIKERVGSASYETWFATLKAQEKSTSDLVIETPDEFFKNWIVEHYQHVIRDAVDAAAGKNITLHFDVNPALFTKGAQERIAKLEKDFEKPPEQSPHLNQRFTFDNFVAGPSNRFAHAASVAVAESPAKTYNPLCIYGKAWLGKTHLMQAIAHKILGARPSARACYMSSERFTNELIDAIRHRSTPAFRKKYRSVDVLLIDDIHFIGGKESTQEEFFHTFNDLHNNRKQIVISSDRPPKEIANLEERLCSRFTWGLVADIQPPDYETRVAILRKKIEREPVKVPDEVVSFIAQEIRTNIRELEGALIRVAAYSLLEEKPISLDMARLILRDMVKESTKLISIDMVQRVVARHFNVSVLDLKKSRRNKNIVLPRQVAMYLSRHLTDLSLPEIGGAFGGKDHTTVLHSCKKVERGLADNASLKNTVDELLTVLHR